MGVLTKILLAWMLVKVQVPEFQKHVVFTLADSLLSLEIRKVTLRQIFEYSLLLGPIISEAYMNFFTWWLYFH